MLNYCSTVPQPASPDHPRAGCYLSCSNHRPFFAEQQRICSNGARLRGEDVMITGEVVDEQDHRRSVWLTGKQDSEDRGVYPKDDVVPGTCSMYFTSRGAFDEHRMGELNTRGADRQ